MSATSENLEYWRANIQAAERVLKMLGYLGQFNEKGDRHEDEFVLGRYTQTTLKDTQQLPRAVSFRTIFVGISRILVGPLCRSAEQNDDLEGKMPGKVRMA